MKIHVLVGFLALLVAGLIAPAASLGECDDANVVDLTVYVNEHVELKATPYDTLIYNYDWAADTGISVESGLHGQDFWFDAPSAAGTYEISLIVTTKGAPTGTCAATTCYKITVIQCCPELGGPFCESDKPNWCCAALSGNFPLPSLTVNWYTNDVDFSAPFTGTPCLAAVDLTATSAYDWIHPSTTTPVQLQTVVTRVEQSSTGANHWANAAGTAHANPKILDTCTDTFNLALDPTGDIDITKGFP